MHIIISFVFSRQGGIPIPAKSEELWHREASPLVGRGGAGVHQRGVHVGEAGPGPGQQPVPALHAAARIRDDYRPPQCHHLPLCRTEAGNYLQGYFFLSLSLSFLDCKHFPLNCPNRLHLIRKRKQLRPRQTHLIWFLWTCSLHWWVYKQRWWLII